MKYRILLLTFFALSTIAGLRAQNNISGAACVIPGTVYDYLLTGNLDSTGDISVCITGGRFTNVAQSCQIISATSFVRVTWDAAAGNNKITFSYRNTNKTLKINMTEPLKGGEIASGQKTQRIKFNQSASTIPCSVAREGACAPVYSYQWQKSANALDWLNIVGANGQHLPAQPPLQEPVFYRRKVTETSTGNIAYSTIATVFVEAQQ